MNLNLFHKYIDICDSHLYADLQLERGKTGIAIMKTHCPWPGNAAQ